MTDAGHKRKGMIERLEGDKVVWIIVLMLILISIVCIFSSTSRLLSGGETRLDMVVRQLKVVAIGLAAIFGCYFIKSLKFYRFIARYSFLICLALLLFLDFGPRDGFIHSGAIYGARRVIVVSGKQIFVAEIVKVLMVLYLAWATEAVKTGVGKLRLADRLARTKTFSWMEGRGARSAVYIYLPFLLTCVLMLPGGTSSTLFCGFIMFLTILIGGGSLKDMFRLILSGIAVLALCYGLFLFTDGAVFKRLGTASSGSRWVSLEEREARYKAAGSPEEKQRQLDTLRQQYSARIAIKQGGPIGKGPGQSTQRYMVPDMAEDFMFSFIVEEYGILGALIVIFLYVSLLARGSLIVRHCNDDTFAKTCVAGLVLLISLQAFLHMFVNAGIIPMTGQTLPLISHGTSSFLCFCGAFGIILSFSRIAQRRIESAENEAKSLLSGRDDDVREGLDDLDAFESDNEMI